MGRACCQSLPCLGSKIQVNKPGGHGKPYVGYGVYISSPAAGKETGETTYAVTDASKQEFRQVQEPGQSRCRDQTGMILVLIKVDRKFTGRGKAFTV